MLQNVKSWWNYQRNAQGKYYLHSPFVYKFYTEILEPKPDETCLKIDRELFKLKQNHAPFKHSSISQIAKEEAELKYGKVIYQLLKQSKAQYALVLNSALGIGAAYIASSKQDVVVTDIEETSEFAQKVIQNLHLKNVDFCRFFTDEMLQNFPRLDVVFCRANADFSFDKLVPFVHDETIFIVSDIHSSEAAESVWETIKQNEKVTLTIDLYKLGLVFFRKENLAKTDFVLRY